VLSRASIQGFISHILFEVTNLFYSIVFLLSLRQLAKEIVVSDTYLSWISCGKRPASDKVQEALGMENMVSNAKLGLDLKSAGAILVGSSPTLGTTSSCLTLWVYSWITSPLLVSIDKPSVED